MGLILWMTVTLKLLVQTPSRFLFKKQNNLPVIVKKFALLSEIPTRIFPLLLVGVSGRELLRKGDRILPSIFISKMPETQMPPNESNK